MATATTRGERLLPLIAVERAVRGLLLLATGVYFLAHTGSNFGSIANYIARTIELGPRQPSVRHLVARLVGFRRHKIKVFGGPAFGEPAASADGSPKAGDDLVEDDPGAELLRPAGLSTRQPSSVPERSAIRSQPASSHSGSSPAAARALEAEITSLDFKLAKLTAAASPRLIKAFGVGADTAGALLVATGDNSDRLRSEAAFSMLCGSSPIKACSGKTVRHRLNRGGNRQANAALYRIVLVRMRYHQPTRDYVERRTSEGKSKREIIRCLKRYVAREVYTALTKS